MTNSSLKASTEEMFQQMIDQGQIAKKYLEVHTATLLPTRH
jgi:hypothetical protein